MAKRILVMGLPGSGKTTFSQELVKRLMLTHKVAWFNADTVRKQFNDWDFSPAGRLRQVHRMRELADTSDADFAICDFVCPTEEYRKVFDANIVIWMNTIAEGRFEDTNKVFERPKFFSYAIVDWSQTDDMIENIIAAYAKSSDTHSRSLFKALSWRVLGSIDTFILSWIITGNANMAIAIGGIEFLTKTVLYYVHERAWANISWGR